MTSPKVPRSKVVRHHTDIVTTSSRRTFDSDVIIEEDYDVRELATAIKPIKKATLVTRHNTEVLRKRPPEIDNGPSRPSDEIKVTRRSLSRHGSCAQQSSKVNIVEETETTTANIIKSLASTDDNLQEERRKQLEDLAYAHLRRHVESTSKFDKWTPGFELAFKALHDHRCVVLTGNLGSGKTFTALNLVQTILDGQSDLDGQSSESSDDSRNMNDSDEDYIPVFVKSITDISAIVDTPRAMVVLADNFLGNVFFNPSCITHWNTVSSHVLSLLERKRIYLIFTCERDSLDFIQSEPFYEVVQSGCTIDLSSDMCRLSTKQRNAIITNLVQSERHMNVNRDISVGHTENGLFGFPIACRLISLRDETGPATHKPRDVLLSSIEKLRKREFLHYLVLVLTMIFGGQLPASDLTHEQRESLDKLSRLYKIEMPSSNDMLLVARQLVDRYICYDSSNARFEFLHNCLYYAVMYSFIQEHADYAIELVPTEDIAVAFGCKKLTTRIWDLVGQSVSPELTKNELSLVLAKYKMAVDSRKSGSFQAVASSVLWRNDVFVDLSLVILGVTFFMAIDEENKPFTVHLTRNGHIDAIYKVMSFIAQFRGENTDDIVANVQVTIEELVQQDQFSKGDLNIGKNGTKFETILTCLPRIEPSLMCAAAKGGSVEIMQKLLNHGGQLKKHEVFVAACSSSNVDMIQFILSQLDTDSQYSTLKRKDETGLMLLHHAAMAMDPAPLEFLVQLDGDPLARSKEGRSILHVAAGSGRFSVVEHICRNYPSLVHQADNHGFTAAHVAGLEGHVDILKHLISKGNNPTLLVTGRNTILHLASYKCRTEVIRMLCHRFPALVPLRNVESYTAPQIAAIAGQLDALKLFFSLKVDSLAKTVDGRTFLHLAAFHGRLGTVQYLCNTYPDLVEMADNEGNTAGHDAAASGEVPVLEFLVHSCLDPARTSNEGCTLLHDACYYGRKSMVEYLCKKYPNFVNAGTYSGYTPCHGAALGGFVDIFMHLAQNGADAYAVSVDNSTMLHEAAFCGKMQMVQFLLSKYPDMMEKRNNRSYLAVHFAAQEGHLGVFQYLLSQISNHLATTDEEQTFLHIASYNGRLDVVRYLCRTFPDMILRKDCNGASAIHYAARGGHVDILTYLMGLPFDQEARTNNESTILHLAAYDGKLEVVKYICKKYPQLIYTTDKFKHNPIHYAASSSNLELLKYLLGLGIDHKLLTDNGGTLLLKAAYNGRLENVRYLCENYPDMLRIVDVYGCGVTHYAVCSGNIDVLEYVMGLDVDPLATTSDGHTLLHIAAFHGRLDMVRFLYDRYPAMRRASDNLGNTPDMYAALGEQKKVARYLQTRQRLDGPEFVGEESPGCCVVCCSEKAVRACLGRISAVVCFCRRD